ncbi:RIB43A-like with coiled-coils protein 2 isoform X2 [Mugil cephalus]|uniref:RIB43A-like with coiled-coils protein 2 isoform X2 n=1 Tax=Mugil cephalus TaxID=48193 RepID=UPI001FB68C9D|nr:RIB43A-like with coiled-coils protein 2 isoform X2 [Mugil cephalus]
MPNVELISERVARLSLEKRRSAEAERQERIFNDKVRTIGVDKEAIDRQLAEKKKREEAVKAEENAYNADMLRNTKVACILQRKEAKEKRAVEKAIATYRHPHTQLGSHREDDPAHSDVQKILPGLVGEDPESNNRLQRQREQLREWLIQQQAEQAAERHQQKLEKQLDDQSRVEMDNKALQLQRLEMERRRAAFIATKDYNLAKVDEKRRQEGGRNVKENHLQGEQTGGDTGCSLSVVGVPGLCPSRDRRAPSGSLQQNLQFQKHQIDEKRRIEIEKERDEQLLDRVRLDSARTALLLERQQAKLNKQLRQQLDSANVQLAETHKQQKPDIERGCIDDSFFSKFNTCSR